MFLPKTGHGLLVEVFGEDWRFDPAGRLLDRADPDTYAPCWCRSGKKFRFCHQNRHREARVSRGEFLAGWEEAADLEMCLAPTSPGGCSGTIIRAHTVQRLGGGLRSIARGGEVYGLEPHPYFFQKNDLRVVPQLIGTHKASTFRGFCGVHDAALFTPVEHHTFSATPEQLFLLNFRTIARRIFSKTVSVRHAPRMFNYDRGLPSDLQRQFFAVQYRDKVNAEAQLLNIQSLKHQYDLQLLSSDFSDVNAFVIYFLGRPDFLCAELTAVHSDFDGNALVELPPPAHLCVYTIALEDVWAFVFSWVGENRAAEALSRSLAALPDHEKPIAVFRFAIEQTDNIFFAPAWYDGLTAEQRSALSHTLTRRMHPHYTADRRVFLTGPALPATATYKDSKMIGRWSGAA